MSNPDNGTAVEEQDAAQDEKEPPQEKPPAEQKEEPKKAATNDGPPPNSPRWNEIYGKWKATEKRLQERDQDVEAMREHNAKMEARLAALEHTKADRPAEPEPDPAVDPDAYKKFHEMRRLKEREEWEKQRALDRHETQVEMQKEIHGEEEYLAKIKIAERDMTKDAELKKKIWGSPNPAKAAYQYGKQRAQEMEKQEQEQEEREKTKKQTAVEPVGDGGAEEGEKKEDRLTDQEIRVCRNLFPEIPLEEAKKKYLKQKKALGRS
jgi:hypothetical protein